MKKETLTLAEICAYGFWLIVIIGTFAGLLTTILSIIPTPILAGIVSVLIVYSLSKFYPWVMIKKEKRLVRVIMITGYFLVMPIFFSIFLLYILMGDNFAEGPNFFYMFYSCIGIPYLIIIMNNLYHPKKEILKPKVDDLSVGLTFSTAVVTIFLSSQPYIDVLKSDIMNVINSLILGPFSFNLMAIGVIQYNSKKNISNNNTTDTSAEMNHN